MDDFMKAGQAWLSIHADATPMEIWNAAREYLLKFEPVEFEDDDMFEQFWNTYNKKVAKPQTKRFWKKLSRKDKTEIMNNVRAYVQSTPDVKYRMNPATYINPNNKRWNDEIISQSNGLQKRLAGYAESINRFAANEEHANENVWGKW